MKLYLLRHGIAADATEAQGGDESRRLTSEGCEKTIQAAKGLKKLGVCPDLTFSSPLPRALETATLTVRELGGQGGVDTDKRLKPGAKPEQILQLLREKECRKDILLVGHNPDLELLLAWLISPGAQASIKMKKGSLAVVGIETDWKKFEPPGGGELLALYPAKTLCRLAGKLA